MGVNSDHNQELDALSLADFPLTDDGDSSFQGHHDHHHRSSPSGELFEFFNGGSGHNYSEENSMCHAEDMIVGGMLIPINNQPQPQHQPHHEQPPRTPRTHKQIHRRRSESMRELKSNTTVTRQLVRNSYSLDYKKLHRNSRLNYEPTGDIHRNSLGNKSSSSRWVDLMFAPAKVQKEMDLRDIRNRQNTSKSLFPTVDGGDGFPVSSRVGDHRKTNSWGVLGILSCKSSGSVAVTMP